VEAVAGDLSTDELLDAIQASARAVARSQAQQLVLIMELAFRRAGTAVGELTGRNVDAGQALSIGLRAVGDELACELTLSRRAAEDRTAVAAGLCLDAPATLDALHRGAIDLPRAEAILDLVQMLINSQTDTSNDADPATNENATNEKDARALAGKLETTLLANATGQRLADLKRTGRRAMLSIDPTAAERRHARERRRRYVALIPDDDSMCRLSAYLPADQGIRAQTAITILARAAWAPGDTRTLDQRRADALVDTLTEAVEHLHTGHHPANSSDPDRDDHHDADDAGMDDRHGPDERHAGDRLGSGTGAPGTKPTASETGTNATGKNHDSGAAGTSRPPPTESPAGARTAFTPPGQRPDAQVTITVSADTLTGASNEPAELHGYGPIVASMARDVAATGTWRCAILDSIHGTLLGLGTSTYTPAYRPTQALRRHLSIRDRTCRAPGCNTPATRCDIDHLMPYPNGPTCECNTECLCAHHHRIKHETGFTARWSTTPDHPPATLIWTGPSGREYIDYPTCLDPSIPNHPTRTTTPPLEPPTPSDEQWTSSLRSNITLPPPTRDYGPPPF
jgi:hypothetical protein